MCGIAGIASLSRSAPPVTEHELDLMCALISHRGPDAQGSWVNARKSVGLAHRRLSIIDLSPSGAQPMQGQDGRWISYNGEIVNYIELREELAPSWTFRSTSDTEVILAAYARWGKGCLSKLRGMFAFAIYDPGTDEVFAARDRFGIKPFHYAEVGGRLHFSSEIKALLPFLPDIKTDRSGLLEYLTFQFTIGERTMFEGVRTLAPGHSLTIQRGKVVTERYWDIVFEADQDHTPKYFHNRLRELFDDSVRLHLRSDVPVGSYLSGGIDSTLVAILASRHDPRNNAAFHGKFASNPGYDESRYAEIAAHRAGKTLHQIDITAQDFAANMGRVTYYLDQPTAGPGSFPQYMVSRLASEHVKVVLGGQGADEMFAGYARYLVAYFEQCLKAAIDGTYKDGHYVVTAETIIPHLGSLLEYKPMLKFFWGDGLFEAHDRRYFRLINRFADLENEIAREYLEPEGAWGSFSTIFNNSENVHNRAYLDQMLHFDIKTLLPALLHVEDRMSMAHGLESRVPFLDSPIAEFLATVPANVKFRHGQMKVMIKEVFADTLPKEILERRDKMGFPVPLTEWLDGPLAGYVRDLFGSRAARERDIFDIAAVLRSIDTARKFSRKTWGLLSLELWFNCFHDRASKYRELTRLDGNALSAAVAALRP